ncbi:MAG: leucine-rich repeat domain-containing protein, partial [Ruminococcus flavefaciens]|nr:leucine-rich repeat domain-containing protein [Ruminococcus flavefaciens]
KNLIRLPDNKLLLPQKIYAVDNVHILEFPICTPLKKLVQTEALPLSQIISLIYDLCTSLTCLHDNGILHMDISVDNIYLTKEKTFILGDFSESCYQPETKHFLSNKHPHHTASKCHDEFPSTLSEQYQLGILFYQLCNNGNAPPDDFSGNVPQTLPALQSIPEIADSFKAILTKMLARNPSDRYSNLSDLQEELNILQNLDAFSVQAIKESDYQLFLPDATHPFHQTLTTQITTKTEMPPHSFSFLLTSFSSFHLPSIRFSFSVFPFILVCLMLILLFSQKFSSTKNRSHANMTDFAGKTATEAAISDSTNNNTTNTSEPSENISAAEQDNTNVLSILDIAGKDIVSLSSIDLQNQNESNIQILLAENNNISSLDDILLFPNLREVYLSNNQITDLSELASLSNLETIVLSDNSCTDLSSLSSLCKLQFLDLSGNPELTDIHDLFALTSLKTLILSDTAVHPDSIKELQQIIPNCNIIF